MIVIEGRKWGGSRDRSYSLDERLGRSRPYVSRWHCRNGIGAMLLCMCSHVTSIHNTVSANMDDYLLPKGWCHLNPPLSQSLAFRDAEVYALSG